MTARKTNLAEAVSKLNQPHKITPTQPRSRSGLKTVAGYLDPEMSKRLKILAVEQDRTLQDLLGEALQDLFKKYDKGR